MNLKKSTLLRILLCYCIFLFLFVVIKFNGSINEIIDRVNSVISNRNNGIYNFNLVPFHSIYAQIMHITQWWALRNLLGNISVFIPLGFLIPLIYNKMQNFFRTTCVILGGILIIEFFQFFTMLGSFDIDDIILNSIGGAIGYAFFFLLKQKNLHKVKNQ